MDTVNRWRIEGNGIVWDVVNDPHLPHEDHIEMSGRKVSVIVRYRVDEDRFLHLTREVIWPVLRTKEGDVRGYLKRSYGHFVPGIYFSNSPTRDYPNIEDVAVRSMQIVDGTLTIIFDAQTVDEPSIPLKMRAVVFPSPDLPCIFSVWECTSEEEGWPDFFQHQSRETETGVYGTYQIQNEMLGQYSHGVDIITAEVEGDSCLTTDIDALAEQKRRRHGAKGIQYEALVLETPDEALNSAFAFAKFRAAESLFETKMGLVHSPGGGRYYGGIWNNDQCEYSGPFFGYLGDADARRAALTAYRNFAPYMTPDYKAIPTSLEMEGTIPIHAGGDRGDAAMYASGAARFALTVGDLTIAEELRHHIEWCLEYCGTKLNTSGVVESDCDELENRFPAGDANLSTNCLYYDGLRRMADLARDLSRFEDAEEFDLKAVKLAEAIEKHFGATVEGFETYRYYEGNTTLRAWICLPLAFGVGSDLPKAEYVAHPTPNKARIAGTLDALFSSQLWSLDGLATEAGKPDFWDRSTLYALRGAFFAGDTERAWEHLSAYTQRRLLGDHVPYPVEANPEGGQAHLSAESALYCRVIVEGMFGLVPTGLRSFTLTPRLPVAWEHMALRHIHAFGNTFDIEAKRDGDSLTVNIKSEDGSTIFTGTSAPDTTYKIVLPP